MDSSEAFDLDSALPDIPIEFGEGTPETAEGSWKQEALRRARECCVGCGGTHKLRVQLIVPEEAGGSHSQENTTVLCRACEMAVDAVKTGSGSAERPVNFWASRRLYEAMQGTKYKSMSRLIRYLMSRYVEDPTRYDDLDQYQDVREEVKINVWVDRAIYARFKELVDSADTTVTFALKALVLLYEAEMKE